MAMSIESDRQENLKCPIEAAASGEGAVSVGRSNCVIVVRPSIQAKGQYQNTRLTNIEASSVYAIKIPKASDLLPSRKTIPIQEYKVKTGVFH